MTFADMFNDWKDIVARYSQISVFTVTRQTLFHHTETEYAHNTRHATRRLHKVKKKNEKYQELGGTDKSKEKHLDISLKC